MELIFSICDSFTKNRPTNDDHPTEEELEPGPQKIGFICGKLARAMINDESFFRCEMEG